MTVLSTNKDKMKIYRKDESQSNVFSCVERWDTFGRDPIRSYLIVQYGENKRLIFPWEKQTKIDKFRCLKFHVKISTY